MFIVKPGNDVFPDVIVVEHEEAWRWPLFILSVVYRIHCSSHSQYIPIEIDALAVKTIRQLLLAGVYDERLHSFDITAISAKRSGDGYENSFATPAYGGADGDGAFQLVWGIWGIWFMVGQPYPAFKNSALIPRFEKCRVYVPVVSPETSIEWAASLFTDVIKD